MKVMAIQQSNPRFWEGGNMATKVMMNLMKCWCSHMKIPEPMMDPTMIVHPWTSPRVFFNPPDSSSISSIWYWYLSWSYCVCVCTGCFFNWFRPKNVGEVLTQTFTFLVGILPAPTLRTFRAEPVKKITLYDQLYSVILRNCYFHICFCKEHMLIKRSSYVQKGKTLRIGWKNTNLE